MSGGLKNDGSLRLRRSFQIALPPSVSHVPKVPSWASAKRVWLEVSPWTLHHFERQQGLCDQGCKTAPGGPSVNSTSEVVDCCRERCQEGSQQPNGCRHRPMGTRLYRSPSSTNPEGFSGTTAQKLGLLERVMSELPRIRSE